MSFSSNTTRVATFGFAACLLSTVLPPPARCSVQGILHQFTADSCTGDFGAALSSAGDLNGDGVEDLMIGEPFRYPGRVFVYSGSDGSLLYDFNVTTEQDSFGSALAGGGDADGDGIPDLLVGAPLSDSQGAESGSVLLFSGATGQLIHSIDSAEAHSRFGAAVEFIDDVDGDAADDLLVGAPRAARDQVNPGSVFLYSGRTGTLIGFLSRGKDQARFGQALASVGDVNGDLAGDFVVGAPFNKLDSPRTTGSVFLVSGLNLSVLRRLDAEPDTGVAFGAAVSAAGDVDLDLVSDFVVGSYSSGSAAPGLVYVYSGADGTLLHRLTSGVDTDWFGFAVSGGVDFNRDGHSDFVVGAPLGGWDPYTRSARGAAYAFSGTDADLLFDVQGTYLGGFLGKAVAALGDTNFDAFPEVVVSATGCEYGGGRLAHVDLLSGSVGPTIIELLPPRGRYDQPGEVILAGDHFLYYQDGAGTEVSFGSDAASNIRILDDDTIQCVVPPGVPGKVDVHVVNLAGDQLQKNGFTYTPAIDPSAFTVAPGERISLHYLCDPADFIFAIVGAGPPVSITTPPFDGTLCIASPVTVFLLPSWPFDDLYVEQALPDDPALSGLTILLQALIGPVDYRESLNASWTNCVELLVE